MPEETINIRPPMWLPIVVVLIGGAFYIAGKNIDAKHAVPPGTITVTGEGKSTVAPDIAQIDFGMDTGAQSTSQIAMTKLSTAMTAVNAALLQAGIDKADISTSDFSLNPSYDWSSGTQTLKGYQAVESLQVKVRKLDSISDVVAAATNAGANQAGNVNFTVDDPSKVQADARAKAIDDAKQKAETLAQQLGVSLGPVQSFTENGGTQPPVPIMMDEKAMAAGGAAPSTVPLPSGQQDVTDDVSITYELN